MSSLRPNSGFSPLLALDPKYYPFYKNHIQYNKPIVGKLLFYYNGFGGQAIVEPSIVAI